MKHPSDLVIYIAVCTAGAAVCGALVGAVIGGAWWVAERQRQT